MKVQKYRIYFVAYFVSLLTLISGSKSNSTDGNITVSCVRNYDYDDWDYREAIGKWKVKEIYLHLKNEGVNEYQNCPEVTIWETDDFPPTTFGPSTEHQLYHVQHINARFRQEYRHLRLLWDEAGQTTEYALYFKNDSSGYWHVFDGQNGSLTTHNNYQQFSGVVQVLKAVNDHMVLNFCQEGGMTGRASQLYSILLSRRPGDLTIWEIESVHSMLQAKKLSVASRRMVCGNNAGKLLFSIVYTVMMCLVAFVISWS